MWQQLFGLTNVVALVGWAVLLFGPRRWLPVARYAAVGLLCVIYVALFVGLTSGWLDPVRDGPAGAFEYSVAGLRRQFASDGAIVIGWTHYLAFDLFVGCWIAEDADRRGVRRWWQAPVLLLTFLAGPAGLLLWFALSRLRGRGTGAARGRVRA